LKIFLLTIILFYFILFYFILFYFILFYFILFYFILFYFILFLYKSNPCLAFLLAREDPFNLLSELSGPENPAVAKEENPER